MLLLLLRRRRIRVHPHHQSEGQTHIQGAPKNRFHTSHARRRRPPRHFMPFLLLPLPSLRRIAEGVEQDQPVVRCPRWVHHGRLRQRPVTQPCQFPPTPVAQQRSGMEPCLQCLSSLEPTIAWAIPLVRRSSPPSRHRLRPSRARRCCILLPPSPLPPPPLHPKPTR